MEASEIEVGQTIEVVLPGVSEWKMPAQVMTALVTTENVEALREDAAECIERGGATLTEIIVAA